MWPPSSGYWLARPWRRGRLPVQARARPERIKAGNGHWVAREVVCWGSRWTRREKISVWSSQLWRGCTEKRNRAATHVVRRCTRLQLMSYSTLGHPNRRGSRASADCGLVRLRTTRRSLAWGPRSQVQWHQPAACIDGPNVRPADDTGDRSERERGDRSAETTQLARTGGQVLRPAESRSYECHRS